MDTNSNVAAAAASVIGARHQRAGRNGQDAAATFVSDGVAVAVVCDGCSSGASSEVGARLGARWFAERLGHALVAGASVAECATWEASRRDVATRLRTIAEDSSSRYVDAQAVHELLLFTIVAVAVTPDGAAVWALGDGAYGCDGLVRVLGPFADNAPPYVAYDLLGTPADAHFEVLPATARRIVIATDGAADLDYDLAPFGAVSTANPDALRRRLSVLARGDDRIAWGEGRVHRTPAVLQDDCAIAIVERLA
ncbi:MAG TPA: protein phosphatase 2C domain-containing protein [Kofleriaceae bacterium]|nr:protein phosphatase 2C domain-containing protein [Kofleriaceae bacterium]